MKWKVKLNFPFNWELKLKFSVLPSKPTPCIIKSNKWMRAIRINGKLIPVIVEGKGSIEKPCIIFESIELDKKERREIEKKVLKFLGIENADKLYKFMEKDKILKKIKNEFYGFGRAGYMAMTVYEGVIKAIIQQQIALPVAEDIISNLVKKYGENIMFSNEKLYDFPSPDRLANAPIEELRKCGLSYRKAEYIKELSQSVVDGFDLEELRNAKEEEIMETLTTFKGIGRWTAELVMIATLGLNVIPADDLGIRKAISYFYFKNELQSPEKIREFAEKHFNDFMRDIIVYLLMAYRMQGKQT